MSSRRITPADPVRVEVNLPFTDVLALDLLVRSGRYASRAAAVRAAVLMLLADVGIDRDQLDASRRRTLADEPSVSPVTVGDLTRRLRGVR